MGLDGWVLRLGDEKVGMSVRCVVVLVSDVHLLLLTRLSFSLLAILSVCPGLLLGG
jgi:hypothetical protein